MSYAQQVGQSSGSSTGAAPAVGLGPGKQTLVDGLPATRKMSALVPEADRAFATSFASQFKEVLHVFPEVAAMAKAADDDSLVATAVHTLGVAFSAWQRGELSRYMATRLIPPELFIGKAATGAATAAQKTLVAGQILEHGTTGKAQAGDSKTAPGKVKGSSCAGWAEYVWVYAGVQGAGGDPAGYEGSKGNSAGPTGEVSFGGGSGSGQAIANLTPDPAAPGFFLGVGGPDPAKQLAVVKQLQPGDWFWVRTGKVEGHSLIFVRWETPPAISGAGITARPLAFSQRSNSGDPEERKKIGAEDGGGDLKPWPVTPDHPITMIRRPPADAGPARTEAELLHYDHAKAAAANQLDITGRNLDLARFQRQLAVAASARLGIASAIEQSQQDLCTTIINDASATPSLANLGRLIALVQRLSLVTGADVPKDAMIKRAITGHLAPSEWSLVPGGLAAITKQP